jgi:arylsulfatase A-like enzyme
MSEHAKRPNFLLIVCDQERYDMVGVNGGAVCKTPFLDVLANEGMRFTNAYTPIAICTAARASLLTGLYPHAHGMLNNSHSDDAILSELPAELPTFSQLMAAAGYRMGHVGKWHVGRELGPESRGFMDVVSEKYTVAIAEGQPQLLDPISVHFPGEDMVIAGIDPLPLERTQSHLLTDAAIRLLESYAGQEQPFFLRLDFPGPHHPCMPPEPFAGMYDPATIPRWQSFDEDLSDKPVLQLRMLAQHGVAGWSWEQWQRVIARYYEFMTFIDQEIGRVIATAKALSLADDTVIIHFADHGDMTGTHGGQFNKGPMMYDDVYRIPFIVRYPPMVRAASECHAFVRNMDLMATILELAGIPIPPGIHARSLVPLMEGSATELLDAIYAEYHGEEWGLFSQRMLRTKNYKLVYNPHAIDELYDLTADPAEIINLVDDPRYASIHKELEAALLRWMQETHDPLYRWARRLLAPAART